ncbi:MAG: PD40 domain-containing protein [Armatimonadetes bacterium]|nr:PD40 domain-containing protein [Armatimonadota bacterium]
MTSLSVLAIASTLMHAQTQTIEPRLLRQPDIHGDTIVFLYAGDLWASSTQDGSVARKIASDVGSRLGNPASSPYTRPQISPDGKLVAFTGTFDGAANIYVVPIGGGEPKRVTYSNGTDQALGWTPDGKIAFATSEGVPYLGRQSKLMLVSPKGGVPEDTPVKEIATVSFFPDGHTIAYNRVNSFLFNWRRYRGGTQGRVSIYDMKTNKYEELPAKREQAYYPMVVGDSIYYISDRANGTLNLYKHSGNKETQLTKFDDADIRWPNTDGQNIVYERDGYLYEYSLKSDSAKKIDIRIPSENLAARPALKNLVPYITDFSLSPSGVRLTVAARGEVFSVPVKSGPTRNMTNSSGSREKNVDWSPDGKLVSYLSDKSGEWELYTQDQLGGEETKLTDGSVKIDAYSWSPDGKKIALFGPTTTVSILDVDTKKISTVDDLPYGGGGFSFSNDGKWLAYAKGRDGGYKAIYIYEIATGKKTKVTEGFFDDSDVCFDKDSKWLFFSSSREFAPTFGRLEFSLKVDETERLYAASLSADTPNPFLVKDDEEPTKKGEKKDDDKPKDSPVDLEGIEKRVMVLPMDVGAYGNLTSADNGFFYVTDGTLYQYTMGAKQPVAIYEHIGPFTMNASHTKLAAMVPGRGIQVLTIQPGLNAQQGHVDLGNVEAVIDPRAEWHDILVDAWRYERDNFYDPKMAGNDWDAVLKRYEGYLKWVNHRTDLSYILGMMIGELGTGHAYVQGRGDIGTAGLIRTQVGTLCADYEIKGDHVAFKNILRGSNDFEEYQTPLGMPGVDVQNGDYLLAIDGKTVTADTNPNEFLVGKVGKVVTLTVNSVPSMSGARDVYVKPAGSDMMARYYEFIENNRKLVSKLSGGRIGYMHIQNTAAQGASDFVRGFYSQTDKDAMIVDERWNGGGYIQPWFVDTLSRHKKAMIEPRYGAHQPEEPVIEGPMCLMINQYAGSGGDFFPYMFRQAKRGPLIGKRTWGGLVGINGGYNLVDGGNLTAPTFAIYNPDTGDIIAENQGIDPDIDVDMRPDLVADGQDPQLEASVKYLMDQLAKMPPKKKDVDIPKVGKNGKINP